MKYINFFELNLKANLSVTEKKLHLMWLFKIYPRPFYRYFIRGYTVNSYPLFWGNILLYSSVNTVTIAMKYLYYLKLAGADVFNVEKNYIFFNLMVNFNPFDYLRMFFSMLLILLYFFDKLVYLISIGFAIFISYYFGIFIFRYNFFFLRLVTIFHGFLSVKYLAMRFYFYYFIKLLKNDELFNKYNLRKEAQRQYSSPKKYQKL